MIRRAEPDGWIVFYADDGETEVGRFKPPADGMTVAELDLFIEHLKREAKRRDVGPS